MALRKFTSDHPQDWDLYLDVLAYAYNTQVRESAGLPPFDLVLSRPPESLFVETPEAHAKKPRETHTAWLNRLHKLMDQGSQDSERPS